MTAAPPARSRWTPDRWRARPVEQAPAYEDADLLAQTEAQLAGFPPLVFAGEARKLKRALGKVAAGEAFLLQGGDCAESFADCTSEVISNRLKVLLQMSLVLVHGLRLPVVRVGRFAGQYAKPRSADQDKRNGVTLPSLPRRHHQRARSSRRRRASPIRAA